MSIGPVLKKLISVLPKKKMILLESMPDLSDNTFCAFAELQRRGYAKNYRFVWVVKNKAEAQKTAKGNPIFANTSFIEKKTRLQIIRFRWLCHRALCLISCNDFLVSHDEKQHSFFLTHGTGIKKLHDYTMPQGVDWCLTASRELIPMTSRELRYPADRIVITGFPRNDVLFEPRADLSKWFGTYDKYICWYPTFRQSQNKQIAHVNENAIPVIHDAALAEALNEYAKKRNILIIVKPHFVQDVSYITDLHLTNIRMIRADFFVQNGISSYRFMAACDSMITDYSSIYFDYLLCDKPVAACWEDICEYAANPGFSLDIDEYMKGAVKIYTLEDFYRYLDEIAGGVDSLQTERREINARANTYPDGRSTGRVVDFIIEKASL